MVVSPFLKQMYVASASLLAALSVGGAVAFPAVLLRQLPAPASDIHADFNTLSWIGAIHGIAGIPSIFLPPLMQWKGRKFAFILSCLVNIVGWVIAFTATSAAAILVSECFHGFGTNSVLAISYSSISEMITPKNRHTYMQLYAFLQVLMLSISIVLSQYLSWRVVSAVMCVPLVAALGVASAWPESPHWLAYRGDYDACAKAFVWLRGTDDESNKELEELIAAQKDASKSKRNNKQSLKTFVAKISRRDFYLPISHMLTLQFLFYWSGNVSVTIYAIEIVKKLTLNDSTAFIGGLIMNLAMLSGLALSIFLNRYFAKKSILLWSISVSVILLICSFIISYIQTVRIISETSTLCIYPLVLFMLVDGSGIAPLTYTMAVEIMPVKHRGIGGGILIVYSSILHTLTLKVAPYLFLYINLWGTFLFYAICAACCGVLIWKFVPETNDRTLQELEDYYNYGGFAKGRETRSLDEMEALSKEMVDLSKD